MVVRMWVCAEHNLQPSRIVGRDGIPRCPECGLRLVEQRYGPEDMPQKGKQP